MKLTTEIPSEKWLGGTPVGNGTIGFMHYGLPGREVFAFNHDSLYRKNITKRFDTSGAIGEIRERVDSGDFEAAQDIFCGAVADLPENCNPYQPFADLLIDMSEGEAAGYGKSLDFESALLSFGYSDGAGRVSAEAFASHPDGVAVIKLETELPRSARLTFAREHDPDCEVRTYFDGACYCFDGHFAEGTDFSARIAFITDGTVADGAVTDAVADDGTVADGTSAVCEGFTRLELRVALALGDGAAQACAKALRDASAGTYDELKRRHIADYSRLYSGFSLTLGGETSDGADDFAKQYEDAVQRRGISPKLYEYIVNMARYMMISCSRSGSKPGNLQGLWCHDLKPEWDCGYTTDINIEMNYWLANSMNLFECQQPLFDWICSNTDTMRRQCADVFGIEDAAYIPQYTDLYMTPTSWKKFSPFQVLWSGAAAWLAQHFFEYWRYSGDDAFMREKGYPYMKLCANFYKGFLYKNACGKYAISPSCNPENWTKAGAQLVNSSAMDITLAHELFRNLLEVCGALGIDDADAGLWRDMDENMVDYHINNGALSEFSDDSEPMDPYHRHLSHIYGIFPGKLFYGDEQLRGAAAKAVDMRLSGGLKNSASWTIAWYANCFARLGDGDRALEFVDHIVKSSLETNMLTMFDDWRKNTEYSNMLGKKVFQIEALFGTAAAVSELLLSCMGKVTTVLPALPGRLPDGEVRGIRGYGDFTYDIRWRAGRAEKITVRAGRGGSLKLAVATAHAGIDCSRAFAASDGVYSFENVGAGETFVIDVI